MAEAISKYNPNEQPQTEGTPHNELRLLSVNEARKILGISFDTLKQIINDGKIDVIQIGNKTKISGISLRKFIIENSKPLKPRNNIYHSREVFESVDDKIHKIIKKYK